MSIANQKINLEIYHPVQITYREKNGKDGETGSELARQRLSAENTVNSMMQENLLNLFISKA